MHVFTEHMEIVHWLQCHISVVVHLGTNGTAGLLLLLYQGWKSH